MLHFECDGNGDFGGLRESSGTASGFLPRRGYIDDFDEDGRPDLVATLGVHYLRGHEDDTFDPPTVKIVDAAAELQDNPQHV